MKHTVKNILTAAGLLAGASVALIPAAVSAVSSQPATSRVELTVMPAITLEIDLSSEEDDGNVVFVNPVLGATTSADFSAVVSTNQPYSLSLNALGGQTVLLPAGVTNEANAPVGAKIPGTADITDGSTSWGVKLANAGTYSVIPAEITEFYSGDEPVQDEATDFTIGLATGTDLLNGVYSGTLVVTAATK